MGLISKWGFSAAGRGRLTRVGAVQQSHHIFGPLAKAIQELHHQVADVLGVVGGERVLVPFDGGQGEALALELTASVGRGVLALRVSVTLSLRFGEL